MILGAISQDAFAGIAEETKNLTPADTLTLVINSDGGSAIDGLALHDLIAALPCRTEAEILGICASAATLVACACQKITISASSLWMVHRSWIYARGNAAELRDAADLLGKIDDRMIAIYSERTGKSREEIIVAIEKDNYMSAAAALAGGWVDAIAEEETDAVALEEKISAVRAKLEAAPESGISLSELVARVADLFRSEEAKVERKASVKLEELKAEHEKLTAELAAAKAEAQAAIAALQEKEASILEREQMAVAAALKNIGAASDDLPDPGEPEPETPEARNARILEAGRAGGLAAALAAYGSK